MPTPTLAELARAGRLGAATAPLTDATPPAPVRPEITLAMLARAGLLGPNGALPPVDHGERRLMRPPGPPAPDIPTAGSALNPLGERIAAWGVGRDGVVGDLARRAGDLVSGLEDMGRPTVANTAMLAAGPVGRTVAPAVPRVASGLGAMLRGGGNLAARAPRITAAATVSGATALGTAETQQPDPTVPNFNPISREEFFRNNRTARGSLEDAVSAAERSVRESQAYRDLVEDRQATRAARMIEQAVARARTTWNEANSEMALAAEEARLGRQYDAYVSGLGTQRDEFHRERAERERRERNRPFQERHSDTAAALPWVAGGIGLVLSALARGRNVGNYNAEVTDIARRWQAAINAANAARTPRARELAITTAEGLQARAEQLIGRPPANLTERAGRFVGIGHRGGPSHRYELGPAMALGEAAQLYPLVSDYATSTPGSDLRKYVMDSITDVPGVTGRIAQGLGWGLAAGKVGQGIGHIARPPTTMPNLGPQTVGLRNVSPGPGGSGPPPTAGGTGPGLSDLLLGRTSPRPAAPPSVSPPPPTAGPSPTPSGSPGPVAPTTATPPPTTGTRQPTRHRDSWRQRVA